MNRPILLKQKGLLTILLLSGLILAGWWLFGSTATYRLGYCQTMAPYASVFKGFDRVELVGFPTSDEVLSGLSEGLIDAGLVSRRARREEIDPAIRETIVRESYALIGSIGRPIHVSDLFRMKIHTYLDRETVTGILPHHRLMVYHPDKPSAVRAGWSELVLIDWRDYQDEPLVMPLLSSGERMSQFRDPFVYYRPSGFRRVLRKADWSASSILSD